MSRKGDGRIYYKACERIFGKYLPDAEHEDAYIGGQDKTPVGFGQLPTPF